MLAGRAGENGKAHAQWISLPAYYEDIAQISCGMDVRVMECYAFESALPNLKEDAFDSMRYIFRLNALAGQLADMDRTEFMKFKAVMQAENICTLDGAEKLLGRIDEYEFDPVPDACMFGTKYLVRNLPDDFNVETFIGAELSGFAEEILRSKQGSMTDYGAVVRGQKLYSKMVLEDEPEEKLNEDESPEWGGM